MYDELEKFILQSQTDDLKSSKYPKEYSELDVKFSFGMGTPAKISWASIHDNEVRNSIGINCVYLYYKEQNTLILSYGIMEQFVGGDNWSNEVKENTQTINEYFDKVYKTKPYRYGDSFVFKSYIPKINANSVTFVNQNTNQGLSKIDFEKDLNDIIGYYKKTVNIEVKNDESTYSKGLFYMESQLEDFIITNWDKTELGKNLDLIYKDGELISKQYNTDIGRIDILAKDKISKNYVVIELKRNQTSDDTVGQLMRYMGWVKRHLNDENVKGIIIAGKFDKKLDYALEYAPFDTDVFIYNVSFTLNEFKKG